jgi:hypothetical protein
LQRALASFNGKLPDGIALALAGHIHVAEVLSFADERSPQFVLGTGGTLLADKIERNLSGEKIAGTTISYGRSIIVSASRCSSPHRRAPRRHSTTPPASASSPASSDRVSSPAIESSQ